jgi:hypothetical protein
MRDHVTHIVSIPLIFYEGDPNHGVTSFKAPSTLVEIPGYYLGHLSTLLEEMEAPIERMRK